MTFREYRPRNTIRAAEITEESIELAIPGASPAESGNFVKGDYAELRGGKLWGWKKADFESQYTSVRVRQQPSAKGKPRKKALASAAAGSTE